jgi:hypothetical protein
LAVLACFWPFLAICHHFAGHTYLTIPWVFLHISKCVMVENIMNYNLTASTCAQKQY